MKLLVMEYNILIIFGYTPWGPLGKMIGYMPTGVQSDIVTHKTNNRNKVNTMPKGVFTTRSLLFSNSSLLMKNKNYLQRTQRQAL